MPEENKSQVDVILSSTTGADEWELSLPTTVAVQGLIAKFIRTAELGFAERDSGGRMIPYRLIWVEQDRYLGETETLGSAGVQDGNKLVMAYEARAGRGRLTRRLA
jgi:hypothetical protein